MTRLASPFAWTCVAMLIPASAIAQPARPPAPPVAPLPAPAKPLPVPPTLAPAPPAAPAPPSAPVQGGLSLDDAVQLTLSRNERAKISDLNVVVADAAVEKAFTAFLPIVTATGVDTQNNYSARGANTNLGTSSLVINQPLLNASAFPLLAQARRLADAQRSQNVDDRRLLSFAAASAFFAVLNAQDIVQAAQHQLDNSKANLDNTQARAQSQLSSSNDVTKAQVDFMSASHELETDKGALDNAFIQLAFTLNAPVPPGLTPPAPTLSAAEKPPGAPDSLTKFALDHRPDVLVAKYQVTAARDFASEPLMRTIPTVGVQGQASTTTSPTTGHYDQETVLATLTWTLFDAGNRYADKHSRDAQADISNLNLQLLVRNVDAQVRSAVALLAAAQAAFHVSAEGVKFARQNVDETAILYRQGLGTALELVTANDSRFTAEVNYASAEFAMAQAYLGLRQALGLDALGTELR
jgi:outer membrane protein TolC